MYLLVLLIDIVVLILLYNLYFISPLILFLQADKEKAEAMFQKIGNAYEVCSGVIIWSELCY